MQRTPCLEGGLGRKNHLVPGAGLEPAWPLSRGILSPLCLPISPPGPFVGGFYHARLSVSLAPHSAHQRHLAGNHCSKLRESRGSASITLKQRPPILTRVSRRPPTHRESSSQERRDSARGARSPRRRRSPRRLASSGSKTRARKGEADGRSGSARSGSRRSRSRARLSGASGAGSGVDSGAGSGRAAPGSGAPRARAPAPSRSDSRGPGAAGRRGRPVSGAGGRATARLRDSDRSGASPAAGRPTRGEGQKSSRATCSSTEASRARARPPPLVDDLAMFWFSERVSSRIRPCSSSPVHYRLLFRPVIAAC